MKRPKRKTKESKFWELLSKGYNRSEAEVILKLSEKDTDKYFKRAYEWCEKMEINHYDQTT